MDRKDLLSRTSGVIPLSEFKRHPSYPSEKRFAKGPIAIIECVEEIPCNPCQTVCNRSVITVGDPITNLPRLIDQEDLCNGCGQCVVICPGLAIFIVNKAFSETEATVAIPYEFLPLPKQGDPIVGIDRAGKAVCEGRVHRVQSAKAYDRTSVVTVVVPKGFADEVRFFRAKGD
jgi:Fe-S-cluster-containing hydrogenase component 2